MKNIRMSADSLQLFSRSPATVWEEAYPLGNGTLGAVVFGGTDTDRICLNHDTLWTGYPRTKEYRGSVSAYSRARELMREGRYIESERELKNGFSSYGSEAYMPMGELTVKLISPSGSAVGYSRRLDLAKAIHSFRYSVGGSRILREAFVSHPERAFVYSMRCDSGKMDIDLFLSSLLYSGVSTEDGMLILRGECPLNSEQNRERTDRKDFYSEKRHGMSFVCALKAVTDGSIKYRGDRLEIRTASYVNIFLCAETSFRGFDKDPADRHGSIATECKNRLNSVSGKDYGEVKSAHIADFRQYFDRLKLDVGSAKLAAVTTKKRMEHYAEGGDDPALPILLFNYGRYLTISASRPGSQPMNLQGIWNPHFLPPWHSNYTVNINTEMNYFPTLAANLGEMYQPLCKMVEELSVTGADTASVLYNAPGWVCHHNTDIWHHTQPVAGEPVYSFWCGASGWLCHCLYEYYEYTLDRKYLRRIYPVLRGATEFYLSQLETLPDGSRGIFPSTSPENRYIHDGTPVSVSETTEMTMAIVRELFKNLISAAKLLKISDDVTRNAEMELPNLRKPVIGSDGRLTEWYGDHTENEIHHRHVSHLYGLHPGNEITPCGTPELAEACRRTLEVRGDEGTGWSLAWKSNFYARLGDGDHAFSLIRRQLRLSDSYGVKSSQRGGSYPDLLCAHPPFQIDGNFGALSGMLEMLVRSYIDKIEILPACPGEWRNIIVSGICAKGARTVDFSVEDSVLKECIIHGSLPKCVIFRGEDMTSRFSECNGKYVLKV